MFSERKLKTRNWWGLINIFWANEGCTVTVEKAQDQEKPINPGKKMGFPSKMKHSKLDQKDSNVTFWATKLCVFLNVCGWFGASSIDYV